MRSRPTTAAPVWQVGDAWSGYITPPGTAPMATYTMTVVGLNESVILSTGATSAIRVNLEVAGAHGIQWLRVTDHAVLRTEWDEVETGFPPVPAGTVTEFNPPCATTWPLVEDAAWTSTCRVTSWPTQNANQIAYATQTIHGSVSVVDDQLVLHEEGTVAYDDQPDATYRFSRDSSLPATGCFPARMSQTDNTGTRQTLAAQC